MKPKERQGAGRPTGSKEGMKMFGENTQVRVPNEILKDIRRVIDEWKEEKKKGISLGDSKKLEWAQK